MFFNITVDVCENRYVVIVSNISKRASKETIIDRLFTNQEFIKAMDQIDPDWWYKTDRIIIDLQ